MEDSAHLGTFARQLIVLSDSLLCLQHRDVNASLLHKVQRGSWNLGGGTNRDAQPVLPHKQAEHTATVILPLL